MRERLESLRSWQSSWIKLIKETRPPFACEKNEAPESGFEPESQPRQGVYRKNHIKSLIGRSLHHFSACGLRSYQYCLRNPPFTRVYLGKLYFVTASHAYDVATQEPNQTARRLRTDNASKKQENESNNFSSRHVYEIATPDWRSASTLVSLQRNL